VFECVRGGPGESDLSGISVGFSLLSSGVTQQIKPPLFGAIVELLHRLVFAKPESDQKAAEHIDLIFELIHMPIVENNPSLLSPTLGLVALLT
jgi:hypothetical protein